MEFITMIAIKNTINNLVAQPQINALLAVFSRALMALIFIGAGYSKLTGYAGTALLHNPSQRVACAP